MFDNLLHRKDKSFWLNCSSVLGVALTMYSSIKDTQKACKLVNDDMSKTEKVKKTLACYVPSSLIATGTIVSIIYSDYVSFNEKISIINAIAIINHNYKLNNCGPDDREHMLKKEIKDKIPKDIYLDRTDNKLFYDEYRGKFFTSTIDNILKSEYLFNRQLSILGHAKLNDFYKLLGITKIDCGDYLGWVVDGPYPKFSFETPWVDFVHERIEEDECEYYHLTYANQPEVIKYRNH